MLSIDWNKTRLLLHPRLIPSWNHLQEKELGDFPRKEVCISQQEKRPKSKTDVVKNHRSQLGTYLTG